MTTTTMTTYDGLELAVSTYGATGEPTDDAADGGGGGGDGGDGVVTVLLAHCWTSDADDWRYQVRDLPHELGERVRIVTWDHRGHGLSSPTARADCTIANLATDLADVIARFAPTGPLVLVGHSIGGMTVMALAEQRPELFDRVGGVGFVSTSSGDMASVTLGLPEVGERLKGQIPRLLALRARTLSKRARRRTPIIERQVMSRLVFGQPQRLRDVALAVEGLINCPADTVVGFYEDCLRHERTTALEVLDTIPTRVLVGGRDRLTPPRMAQRIAAHVPGSDVRVLVGAGHMLPLERDDAVTAMVCDLVRPLL